MLDVSSKILAPSMHNALFASTAKLHRVWQGLKMRDVSEWAAMQRGVKLKC